MAKTAKIKKRQVTVHSRAARRASSPTPKNLIPNTRTPSPPPKVAPKPHVLAAKSSGVQKRQKNKPMKRGQRMRLEKSMSKAEDVLEKLEVKVKRSVGKEQLIKERAKGWEEVNELKKRRNKGKNAFALLEDENEVGERKEREWVSDEEMDEVV
ncbi:Alb1-domain-containing protein, partial [Lophiotrema nucula]